MEYLLEGIQRALILLFSFDPYVMSTAKVQLMVSSTAVILATLAALPLAVVFCFRDFPLKSFLLTLINTGMGLPPVVVGLVVFVFFMRKGPLGFLELIYTKEIMVIAQFILAFPIILSVSISAINSVPLSIRETAVTLGAGGRDVMLLVLREAAFGIITGILAGAGRVFAEVGAILTVGGNIAYSVATEQGVVTLSKTRTLSTAIPLETSKGDISNAIAFGLILLLITFMLNLLTNYLRRRYRIGAAQA
ncbi:MAG: ABC transporter permease subunit [Euryarchaeota archaeon]|nr:ABC transporter permease subunit [Euryarchaeota archaeon]